MPGLTGTNQKLYKLYLYLSNWKPDQQGSGPVTSVQRPVRIELKGSPTVAQDVFYKPATPEGYLQFSLAGSEFNTLNASGLISLPSEATFEGHGVLQVRAEDGYPFDATAVIDNLHIYSYSGGNRWFFTGRVSTFNDGLDSAPLSPFAN